MYNISENVVLNDDTIFVNLLYPRTKGYPSCIEINLEDVRASDGIRIMYDFKRDGWVIFQDSGIFHEGYIQTIGDWKEVGFVHAWNRFLNENQLVP